MNVDAYPGSGAKDVSLATGRSNVTVGQEHRDATSISSLGLVTLAYLSRVPYVIPELPVEIATAPAVPSVMQPHTLAACFESLGDGCEFGLLQRFAGLEVLGLFRFAAIPFEHLLDLLGQRLTPLMQPDRITVFRPDDGREWWGRVADFGIEYHAGRWWTSDAVEAGSEAAALAGERIRVPFLARKLLEELETPYKIFVRRDLGRSVSEMKALSEALGSFGNHSLLWIDLAPTPDLVGTLQPLGTGLVRGYVGGFFANAAPTVAGTAVWLRLLQSALVMLRPDRAVELLSVKPLTVTRSVPCRVEESMDAQSLPGVPGPFGTDLVVRHTILADIRMPARAALSAKLEGLAPAPFYVASCYVWIPHAYQGTVELSVACAEALWAWKADMDHREVWQRVAVSLHGNGTAGTTLELCLAATGRRGDAFYATLWRIEPGVAPADLRPDRVPTPAPA